MAGVTIFFWLIGAVDQHIVARESRVKVSKPLALLAGSSSRYVVWRGLAYQIGIIFNFLLYTFFILVCGGSNFGFTGIVSMLLMLLVQLFDPHERIKR